VLILPGSKQWPAVYLDEPAAQFALLQAKYVAREPGRIPLPRNIQQLWSQHKYSVLARDVQLYRKIGQETANGKTEFTQLAKQLAELLRVPPSAGGLKNALQHIWGHVADLPPKPEGNPANWSWPQLLQETQLRAMLHKEPYLIASTALGELGVWLEDEQQEVQHCNVC
jgi:hypothetical protein